MTTAQLDILRHLQDGGRYEAVGSGRVIHPDGTITRVKQTLTGQTLRQLGYIDAAGDLTPEGLAALLS